MSADRILDLVLDDGDEARAELERLARDPETAAEVRSARAFVERCRALAGADEAAAAAPRGLVRRVLARTTREDLSWRGDLRLLRGFVGSRLRSSMLVRVSAASLAVHLAAVPVVAWVLVLRGADEPDFHTGIEPVWEEAFREAPVEPRLDGAPNDEPLDALVGEAVDVTPAALLRAGIENALRLDRWCLSHGAVPAPAGDAPAAGPLAFLAARSAEAAGAAAATPVAGDVLETALAAELWLDRYARGAASGAAVAARLPERAEGDGPVARLVRAALERARAYGLAPADEGFEPTAAALCGRDGGAWSAELGAALEARGLHEHAAARAWLVER